MTFPDDAADAKRWRYFTKYHLVLNWNKDGFSIVYCQDPASPGFPPKWYPVSEGQTADEAMDKAIERTEAKH